MQVGIEVRVTRSLLCGGGVRILAEPARSYEYLIYTYCPRERLLEFIEKCRKKEKLEIQMLLH